MTAEPQGVENIPQPGEVVPSLRELHFTACQLLMTPDDGKVRQPGAADDLGRVHLADEARIQAAAVLLGDAETAGRIRLRVEIDEQDPDAPCRETRGKVQRGRGLSHAPFLVGDSDNPHTSACKTVIPSQTSAPAT